MRFGTDDGTTNIRSMQLQVIFKVCLVYNSVYVCGGGGGGGGGILKLCIWTLAIVCKFKLSIMVLLWIRNNMYQFFQFDTCIGGRNIIQLH